MCAALTGYLESGGSFHLALLDAFHSSSREEENQ